MCITLNNFFLSSGECAIAFVCSLFYFTIISVRNAKFKDGLKLTKCKPSIVSAPYSDKSTGLLYFSKNAVPSFTTLAVMVSRYPALLYHALYLLKLIMSKC